MTQKLNKLVVVVLVVLVVLVYIQTYHSSNIRALLKNQLASSSTSSSSSWSPIDFSRVKTRDFMRYECVNSIRIGGPERFVKNAPHPLYRIDGSWFICLDGRLGPEKNACTVMSFGINHDYTFDEIMNRDYGCRVVSFDPYVEAGVFANLRKINALGESSTIPVNPKWTFYR